MRFISLFFTVLFLYSSAWAETLTIPTSNQSINLAPYSKIYRDASEKMTIVDISSLEEKEFTELNDSIKVGYTADAVWLKIVLKNSQETALRSYFDLPTPWLDNVETYLITSSGIQYELTGMSISYDARPVNSPYIILPITLPPKEEVTLFVRITSHGAIVGVPYLREHKESLNQIGYMNIFNGIMIGTLLLMALYNLFIYFSLRDANYLKYVLYLFLVFVFCGDWYGFNLQFLYKENPDFANIMVAATPSGAMLTGFIFSQGFLRTDEFFPRIDIALKVGIILSLIALITSFLPIPLVITTNFASLIAFYYSIIILVAAVLSWRDKIPAAGYFLVAWSFSLFGSFSAAAITIGLVDNTYLSHLFFGIGTVLEMVLLSFALANRINELQLQKQKVESDLKEALLGQNIKLEAMVNKRTEELQSAKEELEKTLEELRLSQKHLVESEKMASLGSLVAGVAHEINTPIGIGVTGASLLNEETVKIWNDEKQGLLKKSSFERYVEKTLQLSNMILKNLKRTATLINTFKQVSTDQQSFHKRRFKIVQYINEVILTLSSEINKRSVSVTVNSREDFLVDSYPGAFAQIITNLLTNSLIHGFDKNDKGNITIDISKNNEALILVFADDGKGIASEDRAKIFEPFFTTKRNQGGTGLGLHIVYNLVVQKLAGTITCESEIGKGATFFIKVNLPR
ncbi:MAG: hypothetical protein HQK84_06970 [Nitrospinae bacterium]|nr:hypothetical protein [Nitrospinota bacterium]